MRMYDIIKNKRDGKVLSKEEIDNLIKNKEFRESNIPGYKYIIEGK